MAVDGCMLVSVCIVYLCFGYVCRNMCMMLCVFVYWCAYVHTYVRICMWCEHIYLLICMWWCQCGVDDGFGMNHGGVGLQSVRDRACGCGVGCDLVVCCM